LHIAEDYSLKEVVSQTRCPTLLTWAESDPLSWNADRIYDQLSPYPKTDIAGRV
jgi:hypothetical protein